MQRTLPPRTQATGISPSHASPTVGAARCKRTSSRQIFDVGCVPGSAAKPAPRQRLVQRSRIWVPQQRLVRKNLSPSLPPRSSRHKTQRSGPPLQAPVPDHVIRSTPFPSSANVRKSCIACFASARSMPGVGSSAMIGAAATSVPSVKAHGAPCRRIVQTDRDPQLRPQAHTLQGVPASALPPAAFPGLLRKNSPFLASAASSFPQ